MKFYLNPLEAKQLLIPLQRLVPGTNMFKLFEAKLGVSVEVKAIKAERTREQERYYRLWCGEFAKFLGVSPDDMHTTILIECFGSKALGVNNHVYHIPRKRSGDTTIETYSGLIETLIRCGAFAEFIVPPPPMDD